MAFADNPLWEDSLTYSGLVVRRQDAMLLSADGTAGGAVGGIRPGDIGLAVSVAGSTITVTAGVAALFRASFGVYRVSNPSSWTGSLAAANATNPRIDLVYVRVWDNAVDSSGLFKADVVYLQGTAAPSPVAPSPGATEIYIPLATINVPQSGGGSPSVSTTVRAIAVAPGGISPSGTAVGTYAGQYRDGNGYLERYTGSVWESKVHLAQTGVLDFGSSGGSSPISMLLAASNSDVLNSRAGSDTTGRFLLSADGTHNWGPGNASRDTNLYRNGVGILKTDGAFTAGGALAGSNITTGAWTSFTPVAGGSITPGNGTYVASYALIGKICHFQIVFNAGSTTTLAASGGASMTLPFTSANRTGARWTGTATIIPAGSTSNIPTAFDIAPNATTGTITASNTFPNLTSFNSGTVSGWTTSGIVRISGTYETA